MQLCMSIWLAAFLFLSLMGTMPKHVQDNPEHIQCPTFSLRNGESLKLKWNRFPTESHVFPPDPGHIAFLWHLCQAHGSLSPRQETDMQCSPHVEAGNGNYAFWGHKLLFPLNKDRSHCAGLRQAFWGKCISDCWECAGVLEDAKLQGRCAEFGPLVFAVCKLLQKVHWLKIDTNKDWKWTIDHWGWQPFPGTKIH